jgi:hypothetical protein
MVNMAGAEKTQIEYIEEKYKNFTLEMRAQWLLDQAAEVRLSEEMVAAAQQQAEEARIKLARFIALQTAPDVWKLLSREQADEIIDCQPQGAGAFGLDIEEGEELEMRWRQRTGVNQ